MPIVRTYACQHCFNQMEVVLTMEQVDDPPPECPACAAQQMRQEFRPFAVGNSVRSKAEKVAENIAEQDYHVGNMYRDRHEGMTPKVSYNSPPSQWTVANEALQQAISHGRNNRLKFGSGLDVLQSNLKSGAEPDLLEASKKRMIRLT